MEQHLCQHTQPEAEKAAILQHLILIALKAQASISETYNPLPAERIPTASNSLPARINRMHFHRQERSCSHRPFPVYLSLPVKKASSEKRGFLLSGHASLSGTAFPIIQA